MVKLERVRTEEVPVLFEDGSEWVAEVPVLTLKGWLDYQTWRDTQARAQKRAVALEHEALVLSSLVDSGTATDEQGLRLIEINRNLVEADSVARMSAEYDLADYGRLVVSARGPNGRRKPSAGEARAMADAARDFTLRRKQRRQSANGASPSASGSESTAPSPEEEIRQSQIAG